MRPGEDSPSHKASCLQRRRDETIEEGMGREENTLVYGLVLQWEIGKTSQII